MANILLVDDIQDNLTLLALYVEEDGHEPISTQSPIQGLQLARDEDIDLILLDMMMPEMSGLEFIKALYADPATKHIPVIIVSAQDMDDSVVEALDAGASDYVTKPFQYEVLAARMRNALRAGEQRKRMAKDNKDLAQKASIDHLTGLFNRRHFFELSQKEFSKAQRFDHHLSCLMVDADHFKHLNDEHGHATGDEALRMIARVLKETCREIDVIGRIGGEEFAICCPQTDLNGAGALGERIRQRIQRSHIKHEGQTLHVTVSIGVSELIAETDSLEALLHCSDQQLYRAKTEGRNRVVLT